MDMFARAAGSYNPATMTATDSANTHDLPGLDTCWCGQTDVETVWSGRFRRSNAVEHSVLWRCSSCGQLRSGPQTGVGAQHGDGPGGKFVNEEANIWEVDNARRIAKSGHTGSVLEVGANTGKLMELLAAGGFGPLTGLEPNDACAKQARAAGLNVVTGWFTEEQTPEGEFDVIVISHVLEHIPQPIEALKLARDRLAPGGLLAIFVPNAASYRAQAGWGRWGPLNPVDHVWHFEPQTLRGLLGRVEGLALKTMTSSRLRRARYNSLRHIRQALAEKIGSRRCRAEQLVAMIVKNA